MLLGARQFFERRGAPTPPLPYDAEVEYLEANGGSWIDTGVFGSELICVRCSWSYASSNSYAVVFGSRQTASSRALAVTGYADAANKNLYVNYGTRDSYLKYVGTDVYAHRWDAQIGKTVAGYSSWLKKDGTIIGSNSAIPSAFTTPHSMVLFSVAMGSDVAHVPGVGARIHSFSVETGQDKVIDFIPVRFTNEQGVSEGAMYDRANPTVGMNPDGSARNDGLYRNQGTGAFTIGPDK